MQKGKSTISIKWKFGKQNERKKKTYSERAFLTS